MDAAVLKPAVAELENIASDQPDVDAALRQTRADRYEALVLLRKALPLQKQL